MPSACPTPSATGCSVVSDGRTIILVPSRIAMFAEQLRGAFERVV